MAFKMKGPSLLKMTSGDSPLHQHLVGGRGNKQPKKGLAKLWEKINPFDAESKGKRRNKKSRRNVLNTNKRNNFAR